MFEMAGKDRFSGQHSKCCHSSRSNGRQKQAADGSGGGVRGGGGGAGALGGAVVTVAGLGDRCLGRGLLLRSQFSGQQLGHVVGDVGHSAGQKHSVDDVNLRDQAIL